MEDIDPAAIEELRRRRLRKSGNDSLRNVSDEQLLADRDVLWVNYFKSFHPNLTIR
jgi:hypothetical protein